MKQLSQHRSGNSALVGVLLIGVVVLVGAFVVWKVVGTGGGAPTPTAPTPTNTGVQSENVGKVMEAARTRIANQEMDQAEQILAAAAEQFPGEQQVHLLWGEMLAMQDRVPESLEAYEHAIALGPDHAEYRHVAGTISAQLGMLDNADAHYAMAQKLNPSNPKHPIYRAQIQRKLGDAEGARANLVVATKLDPTIAMAWGGLAGIALDENRSRVALSHIEKARELEPDRVAWRVVESMALRRMGQPGRAADLLLALDREVIIADRSVLEEVSLSLALLKKPEQAAGLYVEAAEANAQDSGLLFDAATWLDRAGDHERALGFARASAQLGHEGARRMVDAKELAGADGE